MSQPDRPQIKPALHRLRRRIGVAALVVLAASLARPGAATLPPPIPVHNYYGPVRICAGYFAIDVREGEGVHHGGSVAVRFGSHYLGIDNGDGFTGDYIRDLVRPLGELDLAGVGRFRRIELSSRNDASKRIYYISDPGSGWPYSKVQISSDFFNGSARDEALLRRVVLAPQVQDFCARIPDALQPRPERDDPAAFWFSPIRPPGPLTLCVGRLAYDVAEGEAAIVPWRADWDRLGVARGPLTVAMVGSFRSLAVPDGSIPFDGPIAASAAFEVREGRPGPASGSFHFTFGSEQDTRFVRLRRKADIAAFAPDAGGGVTFAFSGPASDADISAFVGRLRARRLDDLCHEPDAR